MQTTTKTLFTAAEVQELLDVDRSTVYRMAADGRLPAVRVGRQWRFPADEIQELFDLGILAAQTTIDGSDATRILEAVAPTLGVMMVATDLDGRPVTPVVNPIPWLAQQADPEQALTACLDEWREMAADSDLSPRFSPSALGFECARAFVRSGSELVGMVLAGGVAPADAESSPFVALDAAGRVKVLEALPRAAALVSRFSIKKRSN